MLIRPLTHGKVLRESKALALPEACGALGARLAGVWGESPREDPPEVGGSVGKITYRFLRHKASVPVEPQHQAPRSVVGDARPVRDPVTHYPDDAAAGSHNWHTFPALAGNLGVNHEVL